MNNNLVQKTFGILFLLSMSGSAYSISDSPLFLSASTDPNVLFNMSVEAPMGGAAYTDGVNAQGCGGRVDYPSKGSNEVNGQLGVCYFPTQTYYGYFNPKKCYKIAGGPKHFEPVSDTNAAHECSGRYSGNFMNWATMTAMDEFVYATTGGNRVIDTPVRTMVRRVRKTHETNYFGLKRVSLNPIPGSSNPNYGVNVSPSTVTPFNSPEIFIFNTKHGVRFGTKAWAAVQPSKRNLYLSGNSPNGAGALKAKSPVKISLCVAGHLEDNCVLQGNGTTYKPYGLIQENMEKMRFGVMSYSNSDGDVQDGGVLRSNIKYVSPAMPDGNGGSIPNPLAEVSAVDGIIETNANPLDALATGGGVILSGVISYLNKFSDSGYMEVDPASELFYESTRYYRNLGPTPAYFQGADPGDFPIVTTWEDPVQNECQKHFIIGINDPYPWYDKRVPGTHFTNSGSWNNSNNADFGEPIVDPVLSNAGSSTTFFTNKVGDLEGINGTVRRVGCTAAICNNNANSPPPKVIGKLGEVMGTAVNETDVTDYPDMGEQENTYYIAGLAYYLNTEDIRTDFPNEQNVTTFMIDSQEFDPFGKPTSSKLNLLWLAGKYGGFIDINNDGIPQKDEWDSFPPGGDGEPDNYVLVTDPKQMIDGLKRAFDVVASSSGSVATVASNSTRLSADSLVYKAKFTSADWSASFKAFPVLPNGTVSTVETWSAENGIPAFASRNIFSYNTQTKQPIPFNWGSLSAAQQGELLTQDALNHIRGDRSLEGTGPTDLRQRNFLLGAIIASNPAYVGDKENFGFSNLPAAKGGSDYSAFVSAKQNRDKMIYVAANDGLLHAMNAETGAETFAYVPGTIMTRLERTTRVNYGCSEASCEKFKFNHDGSPTTSDAYLNNNWSSILVNTLGAGGSTVYALDVTKPSTFSAPDVLWEVSSLDADFSDLGGLVPEASIARLKSDQWVAIVANGYDSVSHKAVLYIIDLKTGAKLKEISVGGGNAGNPNGLSQPFVADVNGDGAADVVYAGDLHGNMWKFDIGNNANSAKVAFPQGGGSPLFKTEDVAGNPQPITSPPVVGTHPDGGLMVYFGTGKYFDNNDQLVTAASQINSLYGIRDMGSRILGGKANLQQQTIDDEVTLLSPPLDFRVTSKHDVDYLSKKGWYLDLLSPVNGVEGERVVFAPKLRVNRIVFVTLIPDPDPCAAGGSSWLMELDPVSGKRLVDDPYGGDGVFDDSDYVRLFDPDGDGIFDPYSSVGGRRIDSIVGSPGFLNTGNGTEINLFPDTQLDSAVPMEGLGRQTWRQLQ